MIGPTLASTADFPFFFFFCRKRDVTIPDDQRDMSPIPSPPTKTIRLNNLTHATTAGTKCPFSLAPVTSIYCGDTCYCIGAPDARGAPDACEAPGVRGSIPSQNAGTKTETELPHAVEKPDACNDRRALLFSSEVPQFGTLRHDHPKN